MADDDLFQDPDSISLGTSGDDDKHEGQYVTGLVGMVREAYMKSRTARYEDETRWLRAYRNYRGRYGPEVSFTSTEKSKVFIKVTKTKVLAAYAQICDILFSQGKFPIEIRETPKPEGVPEAVHVPLGPDEVQELAMREMQMESPYGSPGDGQELKPGDNPKTIITRLMPKLAEKIDKIGKQLKVGQGDSDDVTFRPAEIAARRMNKQIQDQLSECDADKHLRYAAFEMALFGTGILKGPFVTTKEYPRWDPETGAYTPELKEVPNIESVSLWNIYPDPDAKNMDDSDFIIQRHKLSKRSMRRLKRRPFFNDESIEYCIEMGPNYIEEYWEDHLKEGVSDNDVGEAERWEVLEYWGYTDKSSLEEIAGDLDIVDDLEDEDEIVQINVWVCGNELIRVSLNPFQPQLIPYMAAPYELNPYSWFGIGMAENMDDTQHLMNGFMRMAVDNALLSGNLLLEVDETYLAPGQDLEVYPGKVFRRQGGPPGQAIFGTKWPNVSNENMQMFDKARMLADESTGFPSYAHGQTGVQGTGRTAAGISMLMGAASSGLKSVVKNIDDFLLRQLGRRFYHWNMQFNFDPQIQGDLDVVPRGTESFLRNEVRSQRLLQAMQVLLGNPTTAPFVKIPELVKEFMSTLELEQDKFVNDENEAKIMAEVIRGMQQQAEMAQQQQEAQGPRGGGQPQGVSTEPTGGGGQNIGVGSAPGPGEEGFSGAPQLKV